MALPESAIASSAGAPFGSDLHGFIEQYERAYPDEVLHIDEPLNAEWEISALAMKLEKAHRFPLLVVHNGIVDGKRSTMPLTTFLMASRRRLARAMGTEVQKAGFACYDRAHTRPRPLVVSRDQAPVKQAVEQGSDIDVRRFPALRHHRMDPGRYITEGHFLTFNRNTGVDNYAMHRDRKSTRLNSSH